MIIQAWNMAEPSDKAERRMLEAVLEKNHSYRRRTDGYRILRPVLAVILLMFMTGITAAAAQRGHFRDIFSFTHAVTGTAYENADDEITVTAVPEKTGIAVSAVPADMSRAPYREIEEWRISRCTLCDQDGRIIDENPVTAWAPCISGTINITIPVTDMKPGTYRLTITEFTGRRKADQDLPVSGTWVCEITY